MIRIAYVTAIDRTWTWIMSQVPSTREGLMSLAATVFIIVMGIVLTLVFQDDITSFGESLIRSAGQGTVDLVLGLVTAVSSTLLTLPIWGYVWVGVALGYDIVRLAVVMAIGSATGSLSTMLIGRFLARTSFVRKRFPNLENHPWTVGRSRWMVTVFLFLGTASPIPCDVFYLACGAKRYPIALFWVVAAAARVVRYLYLGYAYDLII